MPTDTETQLQKELHEFRKEIDANIKKALSYKDFGTREMTREEVMMQRELAIAYTKLQEGKMWIGKCLEAINSPFPEELRDEVK